MPWRPPTLHGFLGVVANEVGYELRKGADMAKRNDAEGRGHEGLSRTADLAGESRVLMTLRVSRDSGRSWSQTTAMREGDPFVILSNPGCYPPCECARCLGPSVSARALRRVVAEPGSA